jgi:hypothetical protein
LKYASEEEHAGDTGTTMHASAWIRTAKRSMDDQDAASRGRTGDSNIHDALMV